MKIVKQLSEDEFVLKMEDSDLTELTKVKVAHDYVQIDAQMGLQIDKTDSNWTPYGKFASIASNWIKGYFTTQISIRPFVKVLLPLFNKNKYCQEEHLIQDGKPNYNWTTTPICFREDDDKWYVHIRQNDGEYFKMPLEIYNKIKGEKIDTL